MDTTITPAPLALLTKAAGLYQTNLRAAPAVVNYLKSRGIGGSAAARFGLGYAQPGWHGLEAVLKDFDTNTIAESGLQVAKEGAPNRHFDRFRDRVMFPIRDIDGATVGFGGRIMVESDTQPKYMNSPESALFQKRNLLYGLYEAQKSIQAEGVAVVVEGYLDVVSLSQAGFAPAVGTLGTACTAMHLQQLLKLSSRVVFCFDGDAAGIRAASHALETALPYAADHHHFDFVFLPPEHDPDSFVRENGVEAFRRLLIDALPMAGFIRQQLLQGCNLSSIEGKAIFLARAKNIWLSLPDGKVRAALVDFCAASSGMSQAEVLGLWGVGE